MSYFQALILAFVQGISEFLPISSSGHLNLLQYLLGLNPSLTLDIFLNTATLVSVLFFFRNKIKYFFDNLLYIVIGSIPAGLVGILFKNQIATVFSDVKLLPYFFLITAAFLFITKFLPSKSEKLDVKKSLIIGLFQAFAIIPAVSRSGSTIFAGLLLGLSSIEAFNFSFCLFIPASIGALALDARKIAFSGAFTPVYLLSFVVTAIVGYFALKFLQKALSSGKLWYFSFYVLIIAVVSFFLV